MAPKYRLGKKWLRDEDCLLLGRIRRGDERAIALLYDRYAGVVYSIAVRVLRDSVLAEQVLSDILTEIWRRPERLMGIRGGLCCAMLLMARNRSLAMLLHEPISDLDFALPGWVVNYVELNMRRGEACAAIDNLPVERRNVPEIGIADRYRGGVDGCFEAVRPGKVAGASC